PRDAPVSERRADVGLQIFDALRPEPASPLDVAAARGRARAQDGARARTERGRVPLRVARSAARALARSTAARAAPVPLARARARFDAAERRVEAGRGARPARAGAPARRLRSHGDVHRIARLVAPVRIPRRARARARLPR